ncbi:MAG: Crp/Fnr family transcriptional regulator [Syntrophorhabdaceae bacterium]
MSGSIDLLKSVEPFRELPEALIEELYISSEVRTWQTGQTIKAEQSEDDEILLIVEGEVHSEIMLCNAYREPGHTIGKTGTFLGLYHFIEAGPHPFTITAQTFVKAMVWHAQDFRRIIECDPTSSYQTALYIARQLYRQSQQLNTYILDNVCWGLP